MRINRNIVECKDITLEAMTEKYIGINRNIVECKAGYRYYSAVVAVLY